MRIESDFEEFRRGFESGAAQLIWARRVCDMETPVSAYMKLSAGRTDSVFLESVQGGEVWGRYSIIGLDPDLIWRVTGRRGELNDRPSTDRHAFKDDGPALDSLRRLLADNRRQSPDGLPPMASGLFGYLGFDMARLMERLPERAPPDPLGLPDAVLVRPTLIAIFDALKLEVIFVARARPAAGATAEAAWRRACAALESANDALDSPLPDLPPPADENSVLEFRANMSAGDFKTMVEEAKEHIRAGDIFQVVPSQRFSAPFPAPPIALYRVLRRTNPSPFLFFLDFDEAAIVGSSPEILVRLRGRDVTVRPIAGTRPRGATPEEDAALERDLLADPKERAEHLMLLDLGRNDVGRSSEIGSVQVTEQFTIERYSHVMHIVSNVTGKLAQGEDALSALIGGFPAGTVSGAPKIRALEIIDALEPHRRGVYAGAVGYFAANGDMDTCIALRTAVIKDGVMHVQAGAGIVADSDSQAEYEETRNKARALIKAAEIALGLGQASDSRRKTP
ncbi:MAG: anthranilate synthase component I [Parvularculaceae bacterium]